jgi:hypothetical protein
LFNSLAVVNEKKKTLFSELWRLLKKLRMELLYDPAIPLLDRNVIQVK